MVSRVPMTWTGALMGMTEMPRSVAVSQPADSASPARSQSRGSSLRP
jgi:hypothetical protein